VKRNPANECGDHDVISGIQKAYDIRKKNASTPDEKVHCLSLTVYCT